MEVRPARAEDAEAVEAIHREAFFDAMPWMPDLHTQEDGRRHFAGVVANDEVWVAERDGELVGFAAIKGDMLDHLYVRPDAQGTGVGSALFERVTRERPERFSLWAFQANTQARSFYEKRNCRSVRFTDGAGNDERQPDVLYEWTPGAA